MRVLIADDCPITQKVLKRHLLDWGYQPVVAHDGEQALAGLTAKFAPRLAILDWMMPIVDGPNVCKKVRQLDVGPYTYIVMLTAKSEPHDLISAFDSGADDYLTKPFNSEELRMRVRAGQRILDLQDRLLETQEQLRFQATHDPLTGLWNRRAIIDSLGRELNRATRRTASPKSISVLLADIDNFKSINDNYGHLVGDATLRTVSKSMRDSLRSYDYLGRFGGEEFIIVLPETSLEEASVVAERIRSNVENNPVVTDDKKINVTVSCGAACTKGVFDGEALIKAADDAMYEAKAKGRNRVCLAELGQTSSRPADPRPADPRPADPRDADSSRDADAREAESAPAEA